MYSYLLLMSYSGQLLFLLYFLLFISPWTVSSYQQCHDDIRFDSVHLIRRSSNHHIHPSVHPIHQSIHSNNRSSAHLIHPSVHPANRSLVHRVHQSSNHHLLFFTPDIHWGTTNDLALSFHSFNHSLYLFNSKCSLPRYSPLFNTTITPQQYLHSNNHQGEVIIPNRSVCALSKHDQYNMRYVIIVVDLEE